MRCGDAWRFGEDWKVVKLREGGAVWPRSVAKEGQAARVWPRAAQQLILHLDNYKHN